MNEDKSDRRTTFQYENVFYLFGAVVEHHLENTTMRWNNEPLRLKLDV